MPRDFWFPKKGGIQPKAKLEKVLTEVDQSRHLRPFQVNGTDELLSQLRNCDSVFSLDRDLVSLTLTEAINEVPN